MTAHIATTHYSRITNPTNAEQILLPQQPLMKAMNALSDRRRTTRTMIARRSARLTGMKQQNTRISLKRAHA
jgi:hypothetical protein